jgi:hypothetical protein
LSEDRSRGNADSHDASSLVSPDDSTTGSQETAPPAGPLGPKIPLP